MRNLKKTLCLVLAMVFVLGLCTVGALDVTLTDIDQVNKDYTGAVKALVGLGIIDGMGDGTFKPGATVTRAQAAKFIAYIRLGENATKYVAKQVFDDVPKTHWASKYIAFCYNNNIINGRSSSIFDPEAPVKQSELCKMLLAACGYGVNGEFVGRDWDANVAEYAFKTKLIKNLDNLDWEANATREEAALLSYNTLMSIPQVNFSKDTESYQYATGGTFANDTWGMTPYKGVVSGNIATGKLVTELDGAFLVKTERDADAGLFLHEVEVQYTTDDNGNNIAYYIDDLCEDLPFTKLEKGKSSVAAPGYAYESYIDGVYTATAITFTGLETGMYVVRTSDKAILGYKEETFFLAELYKTADGKWAVNDGTERLLVTVPEGAAAKDIVAVKRLGTVYSAYATSKEEKVLVTQMTPGSGPINPTWNSGKIAYTKATGYYDKAGNAIAAFAGNDTDGNPVVPAAATTYTVYYDGNGGVYKIEKTSAVVAENDVYLVAAYNVAAATNAYGEAGATNYFVQVIGSDGKVQELQVGTQPSGGALKGNTYAAFAVNAVYTLTTDSTTGYAVLGTPVTYTVGNIAGDYAAAYAKDARYDFSEAVLVNYTGSKSSLKVKLDQAIDGTAANGKFIYTSITRGTTTVNKVVAVWFDKAAAPAVVPSSDYIYVSAATKKETKIDADGKAYDYYAAYKNGVALTDLKLVAGDAAPAIGFYTGYSVKADGTYVLGTAVATKTYDLKYKPAATDPTYTNYIMDGKLYTAGTAATTDKVGMDLTDVVIIDTTGNKVATVADLEAAMASPTNAGKTFTIEFVEVAGKVLSFGGKMIILKAVA